MGSEDWWPLNPVLPSALTGAGHSAETLSCVLCTPKVEQGTPHVSPSFQREQVELREVDGLAQGHTEGAAGSRFSPRSQNPFLLRCSFSLVSLLFEG